MLRLWPNFARKQCALQRPVIDEKLSTDVINWLAVLPNLERLHVEIVDEGDKARVDGLARQLALRGGMQLMHSYRARGSLAIERSW